MADLEVIAALGGVAFAVILWAVTNLRLTKATQAIKADIDAKRTATEAFVDDRLGKLEHLVGGFEARMTAQMPPNLHGELDDVRGEIEAINTGLRKEFEDLPQRIRAVGMAEASAQAQAMMARAGELNESLKGELAAVNASLPPEIQGMDIRAKVLKAITREPTAKERKDLGLVGELVWTAGRAKMAEWFQGEAVGNLPGTSVTYRVSKSPYGL